MKTRFRAASFSATIRNPYTFGLESLIKLCLRARTHVAR